MLLRPSLALAAACATLALTACGGAGDTDGTARDPGPEEETVSQSAAPAPASGPAARAVADLAARLEVPEDEVRVEAEEEVTWRDGSLGCAEEGTMYTQALVDGQRITLRAGGRTYEYHAGGGRAPFLCEDPTQ